MNKQLQFLMYNTPQENVKIDVVIKDETIWLTQKAMATLFDVQVPAISKHLKNIFQEGELDEKMVISILETTTEHGAIMGKTQTQQTQFYNLDAIISVCYAGRRKISITPYKRSAVRGKELPPSLRHTVGMLPVCSTPYGVAVGGEVASPRTALSLVRGYQNCTPYGVVGTVNFDAVAPKQK